MADSADPKKSFTGRRVRHQTRWSVRFTDQLSSWVITVGGIGTIAAICLVFVCLLWVVLPLFESAEITAANNIGLPSQTSAVPLETAIDEYRLLGWRLMSDGRLEIFRLDNGQVLSDESLIGSGDDTSSVQIVATSYLPSDKQLLVARSDAKVQLFDMKFKAGFLSASDEDTLPEAIRSLEVGQVAVLDQDLVERTPHGEFRTQRLNMVRKDPLDFGSQPLVAVSHSVTPTGVVIGGWTDTGELIQGKLSEQMDFLTGEMKLNASIQSIEVNSSRSDAPDHLLVPGRGEQIYLIWNDGQLDRYDLRSSSQGQFAETVHLLPESEDNRVTAVDLMIGRETMLVGDRQGHTRGWFVVRHRDATTPDGRWLLPVHDLPSGDSAVTDFGISQRSRLVAVAYESGHLRVLQGTTEELLLDTVIADGQSIQRVLFAPKDDGLTAFVGTQLWQAAFDPAYPEATFKSLVQPIWYEGYERPEAAWQSSFAGVQSEMKLGLTPLIFGTVKATLYSMLFGVPIALLAAIYTSEFLSPRLRTQVKSLIEMMASLPSVVLGFLGGLVIAPVVEQFIPTVIAGFLTLPICCLFGAYLWQQLPNRLGLKWAPYRLYCVTITLLVGVLLAWRTGPMIERLFFASDMMLWLDQQRGTGTGAWLFILLPISALIAAVLVSVVLNPWLISISHDWSRRRFTLVNLMKFLLAVLFAFGVAVSLGALLNGVGWDPRGGLVGTYVQRNALVVGFVMGFAIIPIIYTISEDSLSTVPRHLRSASLGAGATPLQTAVRIVVPTAMSGLFSAIMIGLGRAVGETMIVLMAAGNTPITEWNIFNGFRTLSANIAVELPEAVRDSTHYRVLFLTALTLLFLTFIINTVAELVRLRFRRRAVQL